MPVRHGRTGLDARLAKFDRFRTAGAGGEHRHAAPILPAGIRPAGRHHGTGEDRPDRHAIHPPTHETLLLVVLRQVEKVRLTFPGRLLRDEEGRERMGLRRRAAQGRHRRPRLLGQHGRGEKTRDDSRRPVRVQRCGGQRVQHGPARLLRPFQRKSPGRRAGRRGRPDHRRHRRMETLRRGEDGGIGSGNLLRQGLDGLGGQTGFPQTVPRRDQTVPILRRIKLREGHLR